MARMSFTPAPVPLRTLSPANDTVQAGRYLATTLSTVDTDLAVGNIKKDTVIFGVTGTFESTVATTEAFFDDQETVAVDTNWTSIPNLTAEIPSTAKQVQCFVTGTFVSPGVGDQRILYNCVEKAIADASWAVPGGCRWEGDGLGSAATLECEVKLDSGAVNFNATGAGFYQTV